VKNSTGVYPNLSSIVKRKIRISSILWAIVAWEIKNYPSPCPSLIVGEGRVRGK
jgi:hypothetical protein